MATNINKIIKTCKPFWPASEDFVNSATVFVNSATPLNRSSSSLFTPRYARGIKAPAWIVLIGAGRPYRIQ